MPIPILMYHAVAEGRSVLSVSPRVFAWQMEYLSANGFTVLPLSELLVRWNAVGSNSFPRRAVAITFDDGFEGVFRHAFPVLRRYGFPATIFLVAAHVGRKNDWPGQPAGLNPLPLAGWDQIREMAAGRIEFGSHTISHSRLDQLAEPSLEREIFASRAILEEKLGCPVESFAFPYGRCSPQALALVRRAYLGAVTTRLGLAQPGSDPFQLARVDVYYLQRPQLFAGLAGPLLPVYLAQRRALRSLASRILSRTWT